MTDNFLRNLRITIDEINNILEEAYEREGKCVYKKETGEKKGCSDSVEMAKKHQKALYANTEDLKEELDDYFTASDHEEEGAFDEESTESLLDPDIPAPWEKI